MFKKVQLGARITLGFIYFIFGGMGLGLALGLMQMPDQPMSEAAATFFAGIMATKYFFPLLKITETLCGFLLLIGCAVPVALVVLAPVTLNIFLFHLFLTPGLQELMLPVFMVFAHILAMVSYGHLYKPLFGKGKPDSRINRVNTAPGS